MYLTTQETEKFEQELLLRGYRKFIEHYKTSDYIYWRTFHSEVDADGDRVREYMVGFAFYDYTKHNFSKIGVSYECLISDHAGMDRIDMTVTDNNLTIDEFEKLCKNFYQFFISMHKEKTMNLN